MRRTSFGRAPRRTSPWPDEAWRSTSASATSWRPRTRSWSGAAAATSAPTPAPHCPAPSSPRRRAAGRRRPPTSPCRWRWRRAQGRGSCWRRRPRRFWRRFCWASSGPGRRNTIEWCFWAESRLLGVLCLEWSPPKICFGLLYACVYWLLRRRERKAIGQRDTGQVVCTSLSCDEGSGLFVPFARCSESDKFVVCRIRGPGGRCANVGLLCYFYLAWRADVPFFSVTSCRRELFHETVSATVSFFRTWYSRNDNTVA